MEDKPRKKIMFPDFLKNVKVRTVSSGGRRKDPSRCTLQPATEALQPFHEVTAFPTGSHN